MPTYPVFLDRPWVSDFIKWEEDQRISRKNLSLAVSQALVKGQVFASTGAGVADAQKFQFYPSVGTATVGSFQLQYGYLTPGQPSSLFAPPVTTPTTGGPAGFQTAVINFNATLSTMAAAIQTAVQALGVAVGDAGLSAAVVTYIATPSVSACT